jgi:hypothetical protein
LKYTDPTGLHDWYDPGGEGQSGPSYEYVDAAGNSHNQTTRLPGRGNDPGERDNTYDFTRVLEALGYSELEIEENPDLALGDSEHLWRDSGCLAWAATLNLIFSVQNLGGTISLDEAILTVNAEISDKGTLNQNSIATALRNGIIAYTDFSAEDFQDGNITIELKSFSSSPIAEQAISYLEASTGQEENVTLITAIAKVSLLPDISPGTHFVVARGFDVTTLGMELEYIGTSKNDDITQHRNYVFYAPRNQNLTYPVERLDIYTIRYTISPGIMR